MYLMRAFNRFSPNIEITNFILWKLNALLVEYQENFLFSIYNNLSEKENDKGLIYKVCFLAYYVILKNQTTTNGIKSLGHYVHSLDETIWLYWSHLSDSIWSQENIKNFFPWQSRNHVQDAAEKWWIILFTNENHTFIILNV